MLPLAGNRNQREGLFVGVGASLSEIMFSSSWDVGRCPCVECGMPEQVGEPSPGWSCKRDLHLARRSAHRSKLLSAPSAMRSTIWEQTTLGGAAEGRWDLDVRPPPTSIYAMLANVLHTRPRSAMLISKMALLDQIWASNGYCLPTRPATPPSRSTLFDGCGAPLPTPVRNPLSVPVLLFTIPPSASPTAGCGGQGWAPSSGSSNPGGSLQDRNCGRKRCWTDDTACNEPKPGCTRSFMASVLPRCHDTTRAQLCLSLPPEHVQTQTPETHATESTRRLRDSIRARSQIRQPLAFQTDLTDRSDGEGKQSNMDGQHPLPL